MATKNAISQKAKPTAKSKGKTKETTLALKNPGKTAEKPSKKEKVEKTASKVAPKDRVKALPQAEAPRATPQIMSGKPKAPPKKKGSPPVVFDADNADPEWTQYMNQNKAAKPVPYLMSEDFQPKTIISHKVLGLGYVLKSQNNRIEVSFKEGKKTLITNYKK